MSSPDGGAAVDEEDAETISRNVQDGVRVLITNIRGRGCRHISSDY